MCIRDRSMRIPLACCLLSCVADVDLSFFYFSCFPFFISIWTSFVFILSFSCGYSAVSSVSVSAATLLAYSYDIYSRYLDSYVSWCHLFIFVWGIRFVSVIFVLSCVSICFPPEVIFRSRVIGACPVTTDCTVAMSWYENNNNNNMAFSKDLELLLVVSSNLTSTVKTLFKEKWTSSYQESDKSLSLKLRGPERLWRTSDYLVGTYGPIRRPQTPLFRGGGECDTALVWAGDWLTFYLSTRSPTDS